LTRYFVARVFRIYPLFIPVLAFEVFVGHYGIPKMSMELAWRHITLREGALIYWTIVVEFQYYFLLPVIVGIFIAIGIKCWRVSLILALIVMGLSILRVGNFDPAIANNVWLYLPCFLFGTIAGLWAANARISLPAWAPAIALVGIWLTLPIGFELIWRQFTATPLGLDYFYMDPVQGFLWAVVLVGGFRPFWRSIFVNPVMRFYGRISYSLYLFHTTIWNWLENLTPVGTFSAPIMIFLYIAAATFAAYLSHRFFETPTINFGKRFGRWLTGDGFAPGLRAIPAAAPAALEPREADRCSGAEMELASPQTVEYWPRKSRRM